jgi:hypothetical protein
MKILVDRVFTWVCGLYNPAATDNHYTGRKPENLMEELNSRAETMANGFFAKRDQELVQRLRKDLNNEQCRNALKAASGIDDDQVLQNLIDQGITPESLVTVSLIPMVTVAWADREMSGAEEEAILKAASDAGITEDSAAYGVVASWLKSRPEDELLEAWKSYIASVKSKLDAGATAQLKHSVVNRSTEVAKSTGGYLGLGSKISAAEQSVLDDLESAFA